MTHSPSSTNKHPVAGAVSTALKTTGILIWLGSIVFAILAANPDEYRETSTVALSVTFIITAGTLALMLWWALASIIDLLRTLATHTTPAPIEDKK